LKPFKQILSILFLALAFTLSAQQKEIKGIGKITGRVIDSASGKPVEYATVGLVLVAGNKVVNGTVTDDKGFFKLTNISEGTYKVTISFIGYKSETHTNISITKTNPVALLGNIKLLSFGKKLKEVTVTSEKSIIENKIDKMVYNVDQDVTSQTGVAADVLKKVPQVSVDVDGNVELQGSSSIRFLINGKPSVIFGNNIAEVLQSIPASQIQSIEVITSPGAKYDAAGTGGIINIILKKSTAEGINGNVSLTGGTRLQNGTVNLNMHHKHFGMNLFLGGNALLPSTTNNSMNRISQDNVSLQNSTLNQNGSSAFNRQGFESGLGFDWDITSKDNISGSFGFDYFGNYNSGANVRNTVMDSAGTVLSNINDRALTTNLFHLQSFEYGLNYKHKFKKEDQLLEISFLYSSDNNYSHYLQSQQYLYNDSTYSGAYGNNPGTESESTVSIDYTHPVGENFVLETGAKAIFTNINSNSDVYSLQTPNVYSYNSLQSLNLNYTSTIYAGYVSAKFKILKWLDVKTGLRYEYTKPEITFSNSGIVNLKPYETYVPSGVISHTFKKNQTLKLSYTHRIERPDYRDLNPFINASDPKNLSTGNPTLRPELGDKIELGYNKSFEKGMVINTTLFYRWNTDDIQPFTRYYSSYKVGDSATYTNVSVTTRENIGREDNIGVNVFASIPFTKKINLRTNISGFQRYITNGALPGNNVQGFNYRININGSYEISKTFIVEVFGNFNSPRVNAQGTLPSFTTYNFALRKQFFNKKASIAVTATNPFNEYIEQKTNLTGVNFTLYNVRDLPYRSFGINFTYKFGKLEFKKEKEDEDINLTNPPMGN